MTTTHDCACGHLDWQHTGNYGALGCTMCDCSAYTIDIQARKKHLEEKEANLKLKLQSLPAETIVCYYCKKEFGINEKHILKGHLWNLHRDRFWDTIVDQLCEEPYSSEYRQTRDSLHYIAEELYYINKKLKNG